MNLSFHVPFRKRVVGSASSKLVQPHDHAKDRGCSFANFDSAQSFECPTRHRVLDRLANWRSLCARL